MIALSKYHEIRILFPLSALILLMTGCANINEGAIDYRVERSEMTEMGKGLDKDLILQKYSSKNISATEIKRGDIITVDLKQVFIESFTEKGEILEFLANPFESFEQRRRGEIAIVANVFEMGNEDGTGKIDFGPSAISQGRVIYYSGDVDMKQNLNESQLPIYGPIKYNGNRLVLQFFIIEIDDNSQLKGLVGSLAKLAQTVYPPASPVLDVLGNLGISLIESNKNDIEFSYSMTLLPNEGSSYAEPAILTVGNYILTRQEKRSEPFKWDEVLYNQEDGRLYKRKEKLEKKLEKKLKEEESMKNGMDSIDLSKPFQDATYMTIQIDKGYEDISLDIRQVTLTDLLEEITIDNADDLTAVNAITGNYVKKVKEIKKVNEAKEYIRDIRVGTMLSNVAENKAFNLVNLLTDAIIAMKNKVEEKKTIQTENIELLMSEVRELTDKGSDEKTFDNNKATIDGLIMMDSSNRTIKNQENIDALIDALKVTGIKK